LVDPAQPLVYRRAARVIGQQPENVLLHAEVVSFGSSLQLLVDMGVHISDQKTAMVAALTH
jgi:hypothetical protein